MIDTSSPSLFKTALSPADDGYYKDGAGSWNVLSVLDTATEIGATGVYEIKLSASELDHDQVVVKFTGTGAADTFFLFDMRGELAEDVGVRASEVRLAELDQANLPTDIANISTVQGAGVWTYPHRSLTTNIPVGAATITAPVALVDGEFQLFIGDDYSVASGRNLVFELPSPPDATGGTVTIDFQKARTSTIDLENHAGTINDAGTDDQNFSFEFLTAVTSTLTAGIHRYVVTLKTAGGDQITVARGKVDVLEPI